MVLNTIRKDEVARLIYYKKSATDEGDIVERKAWAVEKSRDFPEGIKYRLVYIHLNKRALGYDNERAKGHHKHWFGREEKYSFTNNKKLRDDFEADIKKIRRVLYGNEKG